VPRSLKKRQRTTWAGFIAIGQAGDWTSVKVGENWRWLVERTVLEQHRIRIKGRFINRGRIE